MSARDEPMSSSEDRRDDIPADLASVHADDALLDALSRDRVPADTGSGDHQLASLLAQWRYEIDARPMPTGPTLAEVEAEIERTKRVGARRTALHRLRLVTGAAAVAVVAFGAVTVLAQGSNPGDPLWSVKEVMFGSAASQTVASASAQSNLEKAEQALSTGDKRQAAQYLVSAQREVGGMKGDDSRQRMQDWAQRLATQVGPIADNPLTSLTTLPSISGLPPIQVPSDSDSPTSSDTVDRQRQLLEQRARARTSESVQPTEPTTTTPQTPEGSTPVSDPSETTTTTTTPVPTN